MKTADVTFEYEGIHNGNLNGGTRTTPAAAVSPATMPIAIIGMSCRFPGDATNPEKLWEFCADGRSAWEEIPRSRFNQEAWYHPHSGHLGTSFVKGAHFLKQDISLFDASFFNFSSETASTMDPQVRMQLESVYEALENAGIPLDDIAGTNTSVYAGTCFRDNTDSHMRDPNTLNRFFLTGNGMAMVSNRISHFFDLRGPSMSIDTGCSTTLTLLHLACQSLKTGDSSVSIVGGSNALLNPDMFISGTALGLLSPDGRCYSFDSRASGYGRGEGCATIVIKPLQDAIRDGDPIRAIIRETAANQDGRTPTITSPSQAAQEELVRSCYRNAGLDPGDTGYAEAHGTGTIVGDSTEARALGAVLGMKRPKQSEPLLLGSVKTNIGHTEAASGLAGVIKAVLCLEKGQIPPSVNLDRLNATIPFDDLNIRIPRSLEPWPSSSLRRVSVNNFGYGGANAHVIIEDPVYLTRGREKTSADAHRTDRAGRSRIFKLSAKDATAARTVASNLRDYLPGAGTGQDPSDLLDRLAHTLGRRRSHFHWNVAVAASSVEQLIRILGSGNTGPSKSSRQPRLGFVFTGQGAQWYAMGRELIDLYPVFRSSLERADQCLRELGFTDSLIVELMRDAEHSRVNEVLVSLPICVAVQIALVDLLSSWNIRPTGVTGHSSGEVGAAYAAGAIDMKSAMAIVYTRGSLTKRFQEIMDRRGGMMAVGLSREDADAYIGNLKAGQVVVACINSPTSVTVSGDIEAIEELEALLAERNIFARRLKLDAAYHSHHMIPIAEEYRKALEETLKEESTFGKVLFSSPTTGNRISSSAIISSPEHWVKNMVQPVEFLDSLTHLCIDKSLPEGQGPAASIDLLVEIGPHGALAGPIRQTLMRPELKDLGIAYSTCLSRGEDAVETVHELVCTLVAKGCRVDLDAVNFPRGRHHHQLLTDIPPYPWTHTVRHWHESRTNKALRNRSFPPHDLLGSPSTVFNPLAPVWTHMIRPADVPWIRDHQVQSSVVYPGAGYISMAIEALKQLAGSDGEPIAGYEFKSIDIMRALVIPETTDGVEVRFAFQTCSDRVLDEQAWRQFSVSSADKSEAWHLHCRGLIRIVDQSDDGPRPTGHKDTADLGSDPKFVSPAELYKSLKALGIYHGPCFQNIHKIESSGRRSCCTFSVADTAATMPQSFQHPHVIHPTTLDSVLQAVYTCLPGKQNNAMIPRTIESLLVSTEIAHRPGHVLQTHSELSDHTRAGFRACVDVFDRSVPDARALLQIKGLYCQSLGNAMDHPVDSTSGKICFNTVWKPDLSMMLSSEDQHIRSLKDTSTETDVLKTQELRIDQWKQYWESVRGRSTRPKHEALHSLDSNSNGQDAPAVSTDSQAQVIHEAERPRCDPVYTLISDRCYKLTVDILDAFVHKKPNSRIIEIGGGADIITPMILKTVSSTPADPVPRCAQYDFTGTSADLVALARDELKEYEGFVKFKTLKFDEPLEEQGFPVESYDMAIISRELLHEGGLEQALENVRRLLKPGARLVILENAKSDRDNALRTELRHNSGNTMTPTPLQWRDRPGWDAVLRQAGFSGADLVAHDREDHVTRRMSVVLSTIQPPVAPDYPEGLQLVYHKHPPPQYWLDSFRETVSKIVPCSGAAQALTQASAKEKLCIFLDDPDQPLLHQLSSGDFDALKALLVEADGFLWISRGASQECSNPFSALYTGLLRTLRLENSTKRYVSLDLDPNVPMAEVANIDVLAGVIQKSFNRSDDGDSVEFEYAVRWGVTEIPRIYEEKKQNKAMLDQSGRDETDLLPFTNSGRNIMLSVGSPGLLDTLAFKDDLSVLDALPDDYIEISPAAFGLNFRDIMVAMGQLAEWRMGWECSGVISRVGKNVEKEGSNLKVGDLIYACIRGHFASTVRVHHSSVHPMPTGMSFETAASIPLIFVTAYHSLLNMANLAPGETILIHSGAGGVGQAAIMLAQYIGAEIFVTVGSDEKRDFLIETFGISPDHIFSSRHRAFADGVKRMTKGKGVDVVLNSVAGPLLRESWHCIASFGRFIEIGKRDIELNNNLEMSPFVRSVTYASLDLITLGELRGSTLQEILKKLTKLFETSAIRPVGPLHVFPVSETERAFRTMTTGKHMGKIVLRPGPDDLVKVLPPAMLARLEPSATYLIVGGLGGIGRSISRLMVDRGARNLLLLSRSAALPSEKQQAFLRELECLGVNVVVKSCDTADTTQLSEIVRDCRGTMPPIKGLVQGAMVLRDSIFEQMSWEDYNAVIQPKVQGSWNLYTVFLETDQPPLDFFILLSSVSGVGGNASQANYAAGGTFQDALARYRVSHGLPAVSLDLGPVKSVGVVAESARLADRLERLGMRALEAAELLRLVELAILYPRGMGKNDTEDLRTSNFDACQIITGVPASFVSSSESTTFWDTDPRFSTLEKKNTDRPLSENAGSNSHSSASLSALLVDSTSLSHATNLILDHLISRLASMFLKPKSEIIDTASSASLASFGIDSLVAVELRNWLQGVCQVEISVFDVMRAESLFKLAGKVAGGSKLLQQRLKRQEEEGKGGDGLHVSAKDAMNGRVNGTGNHEALTLNGTS